MKSRVVSVKAIWDKDAQVWIAISEDVPGLVTEADTLEQLIEKLRVMIPELLEANGLLDNNEEKIFFIC
jgi:predicted RNase H-like HicB family nuclease